MCWIRCFWSIANSGLVSYFLLVLTRLTALLLFFSSSSLSPPLSSSLPPSLSLPSTPSTPSTPASLTLSLSLPPHSLSSCSYHMASADPWQYLHGLSPQEGPGYHPHRQLLSATEELCSWFPPPWCLCKCSVFGALIKYASMTILCQQILTLCKELQRDTSVHVHVYGHVHTCTCGDRQESCMHAHSCVCASCLPSPPPSLSLSLSLRLPTWLSSYSLCHPW